MKDTWRDKWNERYSGIDYAYGEQPNRFLEEQLVKLTPGTILFPAEGEGRNAVYAAKKGWQTFAFDISDVGKKKAIQLAEANQVNIDYQVGELETLGYQPEQFDSIALIYAHFPAAVKSNYHQIISGLLKKGGTLILEAFSKRHLEYLAKDERVGGPRDIGSLFSIGELEADFKNYEVDELVEKEIELSEGLFHRGTGSVIRFVGRKK